jgi:hypothetical protein
MLVPVQLGNKHILPSSNSSLNTISSTVPLSNLTPLTTGWNQKAILGRKRAPKYSPFKSWFRVQDIAVNSVYASGSNTPISLVNIRLGNPRRSSIRIRHRTKPTMLLATENIGTSNPETHVQPSNTYFPPSLACPRRHSTASPR